MRYDDESGGWRRTRGFTLEGYAQEIMNLQNSPLFQPGRPQCQWRPGVGASGEEREFLFANYTEKYRRDDNGKFDIIDPGRWIPTGVSAPKRSP